jgi:hypothetical protein
MNNYLETAKQHESAFRAILTYLKVNHQSLTLDEIYEKYSTGDRDGIWSILDFYIKDSEYYLIQEDITFLSGYGRRDKYNFENGIVISRDNISYWRS